jgi:ubiquinone/menaquinone biosynthesis C-methylase UbiE
MKQKEEIRNTVRQTYGNIAVQGSNGCDSGISQFCYGPSGSKNQSDLSGCGCGKWDLNTDQISAFLGYSQEDLRTVPYGANLGLGCGNPQAIASIKPDEVVVDLGSGGGFDCFLAARKVGATGRIIGVDMTPEMISLARVNKEKAAVENVEFRLGEIEYLPVGDSVADLIISNCVINLSPEKKQVYQDAFRVLKPGGRLAVADIVAQKPLPEAIQKDLALVSACIGGAATIEDTQKMLKQAGFENITITPKKISQELINEILPGSLAGEYVVSANIQAQKPFSAT